MILDVLDEAVAAGARLARACEIAGLSIRTVQRWRLRPEGGDRRCGPRHMPANALSEAERARVLRVVNSPRYRDLSPRQIVPMLADEGTYLASESTIYRLLRSQSQMSRRGRTRSRSAPQPRATHLATGPNQVWSWDITYLRSAVRGRFHYLYLIMDIWSRRIVGWAIHRSESANHAASLMTRVCEELRIDPTGLVLHSDNGAPMRGATMLATLQWLGVVPSFSRPHVSNDNPYSEALFRTLKYTPSMPQAPFANGQTAQVWVGRFVHWYNDEHRHSAIGYVTPNQRHQGYARAILRRRLRVYEAARRRRPGRWSGDTRRWLANDEVVLNPERVTADKLDAA